ncbi:dihydropteroate synthase [Streptomyces sp. MMS24-I2-30]|uniref:dihydropteroate synthase n=1 Tax=Streptomyces sp. MMS24-I2-30 TaxID=3351564 RepID=UPI0038969C37
MRERCLVMGILNVTPDSFSDGGDHLATTRAVDHGLALALAGADIVDVGGESTRPGAHRVPLDVELSRTVPVVRALADSGVIVSIDTMRSAVACAALEAGARLVNDVSGGLADPAMAASVAWAGVPYVAMHWRGPSRTMRRHAVYRDVVSEVRAELGRRLHVLVDAGISAECIVLDPGLGFAKNGAHDWELLRHLGELSTLGRPLLVGASRKSFLGALPGTDADRTRPPGRDAATAAVSALAAAAGAYCVRVHEVALTLDAVRVAAAWTQDTRPGTGP